MVDTFVVSIDGSDISTKVVEHAAKMAKLQKAKVILMHVIPHLAVPEEFVKYASMERLENPRLSYFRGAGEAILSKFCKELVQEGIEYETLVEEGHPPDRIVVARSRNAALIVMGFIGFHGVGRIRALGSVSRKVMESTDRPVLLVPA